jgi:hypothetical protein
MIPTAAGSADACQVADPPSKATGGGVQISGAAGHLDLGRRCGLRSPETECAGGRRVVIPTGWGAPESHPLTRQHPNSSPGTRCATPASVARRAFSIEAFPERVLGTMRCLYCGLWHEVNRDGVVEGMCEAEWRARKL